VAKKRLTDRVALIVVLDAGKREEFGFKISQPWRALGQEYLPCLKFSGRDSHPALLVAFGLDGDDAGNARPQFLNQAGPGAGILHQNALRLPAPGLSFHGCLEGGIVDAHPVDVDQIPPHTPC
jgi:hypothetical protein